MQETLLRGHLDQLIRSCMFGHAIADAMGVMFDMGITTSRAFVDLLEMDKELTE